MSLGLLKYGVRIILPQPKGKCNKIAEKPKKFYKIAIDKAHSLVYNGSTN